MADNQDIPFFSYFHRAKREGLTDVAAYHYAITEDIYDAEGNLLKPGDARPDGVCYHPQDMLSKGGQDIGPTSCPICGVVMEYMYPWDSKGRSEDSIYWHPDMTRPWFFAPPRKIATRSQTAYDTLDAILAATNRRVSPSPGTFER